MFSRISKGLVLALSVTATAFAVGCAGTADENVASDEGAATASAALAHDYEGTIGNLKVFVRLDVQGSAISGSYFYADKVGNGDTLILKGSASGSKLTMTESVNGAGAATGAFDGTIGAGGITGTWKAGARTLPLNLTAIKSLKTVQHKYNAAIKAPAVPGEDWHRDCSLEAEAVEIFGLEANVEKAMMDALKIEPLDHDEKGQCESDIRYVSQSVEYTGNGFLTIHVATEYDGGAHPENQTDYFNFEVASGANVGPNDIFAAGSKAKVKDLIEKQINAQQGPEFTAEDAQAQIEEFQEHFDMANDDLAYITMGVTQKGLVIDMGNNYPHVILALAPIVTVPWSDVKPLLKAGSPAAAMTK